MKKKILILIVLVCSFFACFSVKTYASTDYRTKIGYFEYDSDKDIFDKTSRLFISYIEEMAKGQPEEER